jgi:acyl-CoA thioester hydrolase
MSTNILAPRLADYSVRTSEKLRFADTDRNGHITNTVFAVCCQNARMEVLCDPKRVPIPRNTQFVIARLMLEFRAEMHWPGTVEIGTRVERVGQSSVTLAQALFVDGHCVATAESVVALMDTTTRRSTQLPHETAEALFQIASLDCARAPPQRRCLGSGLGEVRPTGAKLEKIPNIAQRHSAPTKTTEHDG